MTTTEDTRFEIASFKFKEAAKQFVEDDEAALSLLETRQCEIMDAAVDKAKKADAFDYVLNEIERIFPRADSIYCQALEKRVAFTPAKEQTTLLRLAQCAYMHRRGANVSLYGKVIYDVYQKLDSQNKKNYPFLNIKEAYRKNKLKKEKEAEYEDRCQRLNEIDFYLSDEQTAPEKKISLVDEALDLLQEKYFKRVKANEIKADYCRTAAKICREELFDEAGARYYESKAFNEYERKASNAFLRTPQGNTPENRKKHMQKFHPERCQSYYN